MTYYTIYQIKNVINNKIYIGAHKTDNLNDDYMGSGKHLNYAKQKYGIENFEKEYLFIYESADDMWNKEAELVDEEFISDTNTYNLKVGGEGGWDFNNNSAESIYKRTRDWSISGTAAFKKKYNEDTDFNNKINKNMCIMSKLGHKRIKEIYPNGIWYGKRHTEETKRKIGEANSKHQSGSGNSNWGKMWITNDSESMMILKTDPIPEGFRKGRKIKL